MTRTFALACAMVSAFALPPAQANLLLTPAGLQPGDSFRVVFTSSQRRDALSASIGDYDAFIAGLATAAGMDTYFGMPITWQVLGSTAGTSALDRVGLDSPGLYLRSGTKVADGGADLWDGTLDAGVFLDERGFFVEGPVFTGTFPNGRAAPDPLGGSALPLVMLGFASALVSDSSWVTVGATFGGERWHFYGVSSELTVPVATQVPEPPGLALFALGLAGLAARKTLVAQRRAS